MAVFRCLNTENGLKLGLGRPSHILKKIGPPPLIYSSIKRVKLYGEMLFSQ